MNPAERLMENLLLCIKDQIKYAKALDGDALSEATAHRQDLLFELELEQKNNNVSVTERMKELHQEITSLDERLLSILATVTKACKGLKTKTPVKVYGANGRMKR